MSALEHKVLFAGNKRFFRPCVAAPEHKYHGCVLLIYDLYDSVCQNLPSLTLMTLRRRLADGEGGVEKQHTLLCPSYQLSCRGLTYTELIM